MTNRNPIAVIKSVALTGFNGQIVDVETASSAGLPGLQIVGMGNKAIDEARQRVRSAITYSLLQFPARKITVNLSPAELPKDGTHFDLSIALGILVNSGQIKPREVEGAVFAGELALDGRIKTIRGAVTIAEEARSSGATRLFVPIQNVAQASLVPGIRIIGISTLKGLFQQLRGLKTLSSDDAASTDPITNSKPPITRLESPPTPVNSASISPIITIDSIIGQENAKRALAIAAAGRHNLLLSGPPGTGKTLLAKALASLLPPLSNQEILEVTKLHSLSSGSNEHIHTTPPLRSPHHNVTLTALIGGGLKPKPGDISLAHKGVLFLDELPEYPRATLEALRQPLEDRVITLSRLYGSVAYPADIILVATMNPCPCGYLGDEHTACTCSSVQINAYQKKISGPLLDRIDLRINVSRVSYEQFFDSNSLIKKQQPKVLTSILTARKAQAARYNRGNYYNAYASISDVKKSFLVTAGAQKMTSLASKKLALSNRSSLRIMRVARTIADLDGSKNIEEKHIAEALQFR